MKSDCPVQIFRNMINIKIKYRLLVYLTSYTGFFSGDMKKKALKKKKKALKMTS